MAAKLHNKMLRVLNYWRFSRDEISMNSYLNEFICAEYIFSTESL